MELLISVALWILVAVGISVVIILNKIRTELRLVTTESHDTSALFDAVDSRLDGLPEMIAWHINEKLPPAIASELTASHLSDRIGVKVSEEMMGTHRLPESVAKCVGFEIESFGEDLRSIAENTSSLRRE